MLAGLMKAPSKLAPDRNPEGASERAAQVIVAMQQEGLITDAMAKTALSYPAQARHDTGAGSINYVADYVMDMLNDTIGAVDQDIVVTTTVDARLQMAAEGALAEELEKKGAKFGVTQGAIMRKASSIAPFPPSASRARPSSPSSISPASNMA